MAGRGSAPLVVRALQWCCRVMWGFSPEMIPHIVAAKGTAGSLRWFAANMPRYLTTLHVLGPVRTHLSAMVVALYQGCVYCGYGHGYALELLYLRERDRLFPLDAGRIDGWLELSPRELGERMRRLLQESGMHREAIWVDRTLDLLAGHAPADEAEARIAHLVAMVGEMSRIAIAAGVAPDGAQDAVNKDAALRARNAELRAAAV